MNGIRRLVLGAIAIAQIAALGTRAGAYQYRLDNGAISTAINASDGIEARDAWFANEFTVQAGGTFLTRVDFGVFTTAPNSTGAVVLYRVTDPGGNPALGATRVYTQAFTPLTGDNTNAFLQQITLTTPVAFNVGDKLLVAVLIRNVIALPPNDKYPFLLDTSGVAAGTYWDRSNPNLFNLDDLSGAKPINQNLAGGAYNPGPGHVFIRAQATDGGPNLVVSPTSLTPSCTLGYNAADQSFQVQNNGSGTLDYTISKSVSWLSCTPASGSTTGTDTIVVSYTTSGLSAGTHNGTITVTAAGASGSPKTIAVTLTVSPPPSAPPSIWALTRDNDIVRFESTAPSKILEAHAITGLTGAEEIRAIDWWNGTMYGLGSGSRLYTIDLATGAATQVGSGQFSLLLNGQSFAMDNGPSGVVVVSDLGQNLTIDRATGAATAGPAVTYAAGDPYAGIKPQITALAYDAAAGVWYAGDSLQNSVARLNPTTGVLNTVGLSGLDFSAENGLDVSAGIMYLASPAASSDPAANLYTVNKATAMATLVGLIGPPGDNILVRGLTVVPQ